MTDREMKEVRCLSDAKIGEECVVCGMQLPRATTMRLTALGMTAGTKVEILNSKRNGSVIFKVRGTRLAVGRRIAEQIFLA